ncbi:MAG: potassium-transporting ATPase subunit C [Gammaproteobacteria bacterium GWE2_42_36]|nr:MAG: potassium-transporting ATPase subunit C [Gammaproteobacteria bacterium GWE2_42_36]
MLVLWHEIKNQLKPAFLLFISLAAITGILYPLCVTGIAQLIFHPQANGSLITLNHEPIGSTLIGQYFDRPNYFWGRPSATDNFPYNALASRGSNIGPTNPELVKQIEARIDQLKKSGSTNGKIPVDLITASGSGLDPDISLAAAYYQIHRIATVRHIPEAKLQDLIATQAEKRQWRFLGEPRVNVLALNLALDTLAPLK